MDVLEVQCPTIVGGKGHTNPINTSFYFSLALQSMIQYHMPWKESGENHLAFREGWQVSLSPIHSLTCQSMFELNFYLRVLA